MNIVDATLEKGLTKVDKAPDNIPPTKEDPYLDLNESIPLVIFEGRSIIPFIIFPIPDRAPAIVL